MPAGHDLQTEADVDPDELEKVPTGHCWHEAWPGAAPNVPGPHATQSEALPDPGSEKLPAGHCKHDACDVEPFTSENQPPGHRLHLIVPNSAANEPGAQGRHDSSHT